MTRSEKTEIAAMTRILIDDRELTKRYGELNGGSAKGWRSYLRNELTAFWTDGDPYLDKRYLDIGNVVVGKRILNIDDAYCFVRDNLDDDICRRGKAVAA